MEWAEFWHSGVLMAGDVPRLGFNVRRCHHQ